MARIVTFERTTKGRTSVHDVVKCTYAVYTGPDGCRYFQIDTYGSANRRFAGTPTQEIQLGQEAAAQLIRLLQEAFPEPKP